MRSSTLVLSLFALGTLAACGGEEAAQDEAGEMAEAPAGAVAAAPLELDALREEVLANEWIDAFTVTLEPGQAVAPHEGRARFIYSLSDYTIRYTEGDATRETTWQAGEVHAHEAGSHAMENVGTTPARLLIVSRLDAPLPGGESVPSDDVEDGATLRLDDDRFRVTEIALPAGATRPMHGGMARLVYSLSDYTLRYTEDGGEPSEQTFAAGDAHWHAAGQHAVENSGETEARFLVVALKQ
jgi:uncharacterized cupin superfamily protein